MDSECDGRATGRFGDAKVGCVVGGSEHDKVGDSEGACYLDKVFEDVSLAFFQSGGCIWGHELSQVAFKVFENGLYTNGMMKLDSSIVREMMITVIIHEN